MPPFDVVSACKLGVVEKATKTGGRILYKLYVSNSHCFHVSPDEQSLVLLDVIKQNKKCEIGTITIRLFSVNSLYSRKLLLPAEIGDKKVFAPTNIALYILR